MNKPEKSPGDLSAFSYRMREELRSRLEKAAAMRNDSINNEITRRLEITFSREDMFGGTQIQQIEFAVIANFLAAGMRYAVVNGKSTDPSEWLSDPRTYFEALQAALDTLVDFFPGGPPTDMYWDGLLTHLLARKTTLREQGGKAA